MTDYLFPRGKKQYLSYRLQNPPGLAEKLGWKVKVVSTGTADRYEALQHAIPDILDHKQRLWAERAAMKDGTVRHAQFSEPDFEPNEVRRQGTNTWRCTADGKFLIITPDSGEPARVEPNQINVKNIFDAPEKEMREFKRLHSLWAAPNRKIDDDIFHHWSAGKTRGNVLMLQHVMDKLHEIAPNKSLITVGPSDIRALEAALVAAGNSTASMQRKFGLARAMMNRAIAHEKFPRVKTNPFVVEDLITPGLKGRRPANKLFNDDDLALVSAALPSWPPHIRLYWLMLRTMGGRAGEPCQIVEEETINGYRCVLYGTKVPATERFCPLSQRVLDELGDRRITGNPFPHPRKYMAERINVHLQEAGIRLKAGKTLQSLRAGFDTTLTNNGVPRHVTDTICGHVDDMKGNENGNQEARQTYGVKWRYMRGLNPKLLFDAMSIIQTGV